MVCIAWPVGALFALSLSVLSARRVIRCIKARSMSDVDDIGLPTRQYLGSNTSHDPVLFLSTFSPQFTTPAQQGDPSMDILVGCCKALKALRDESIDHIYWLFQAAGRSESAY